MSSEKGARRRTAVVTGGGRGIGQAIARALAAGGARVVLTCRQDLARAEKTAEEIRAAGGEAIALVADVRQTDAVKAAAERVEKEFGGADILVNNAGVIKDALLPFMKEDDWDFVLDTDLKGAFRMTKAFLRPMLHRGWGRIVNVVSVSGISGHHARITSNWRRSHDGSAIMLIATITPSDRANSRASKFLLIEMRLR